MRNKMENKKYNGYVYYYPVGNNGYIKHIQRAHAINCSLESLKAKLKKRNAILVPDPDYDHEPDCGELCGKNIQDVYFHNQTRR